MSDFAKRVGRIVRGKINSGVGAVKEQLGLELDEAENFARGEASESQQQTSSAARPSDEAAKRIRYFQILELKPSASQAEIKAAYRRLCREYHPDKFHGQPDKVQFANELLRKINEAYEALKSEP